MLEDIDGHIIDKRDLILRPGATRRVSFRGTPGGNVSIRIFAKRGPNLGDNEDPVDPLPGGRVVGALEGVAVREFQLSSRREASRLRVPENQLLQDKQTEQLVKAQVLAASRANGANGTGVSFLDNNPAGRPLLSFDNINDIVVIPNPNPNPPLIIQQAMRIRFRVRDGVTFHDETTQPIPNGHPGRITVSSNHTFSGHDIIDVLFTNPNDFPVIFSSFINVQNNLTITTTSLSNDLIERLLGDTLLLLAPSFGIRKGKLFFGFNKEVEDELEISNEPIDIGIDLDASLEIKPLCFELLSNEELIRRLATEVESEIKAKAFSIFPIGINPADNIPADFVTQFVNTFFSDGQLPDLLDNMGLSPSLWAFSLFSRPLLTGSDEGGVIQEYKKGRRNDVAIKFSLKLTEIIAGTSRLEVNVDTITADLYIVLRNGRTFTPHPNRELIDDKIPTDTLFPRFQLKVDISRIDVELDLGDNIVTNTIEYFAEKGLEALGSYLRDDFEGAAVDEGMKFLEANIQKIGKLASEMMVKLANRDHLLHDLSTNTNKDWVIETLNPSQLAVPFVPEDLIDHRFDDIAINEEAVQPIDGPMPQDALNRLGKVTNLVFLMMENRSFDHMLGYLSHPNHGARADVDGLNGQEIQVGGTFEGTSATPQSSPRHEFSPNPAHNAESVAVQINDGAMDGFVSEFDRRIQSDDEINPNGNQNDPFRILNFYTASDLRVYNDLSTEALILDRWFCSIPGGTYPNRSCYYSGNTPFIKNEDIFHDAGYLPQLTLFDLMDKQGIDWKIYESSVSFLRMYDKYRLENAKIRPIEELLKNERPILPSVTFIDPDFKGSTGSANDDHAPTDIKKGQDFIEKIIDTLKKNPNWATTMFVIIYDEHGGFADHVPPPGTSTSDFPPDIDGQSTVPLAHPEAGSYGVRVPAIIVSPLINAGDVGHKIYDHASVYKTILEKFMPQIRHSQIVPERVRQARHLGELVSDRPIVLANPDIIQPPVAPFPGIIAPDVTVLENPDLPKSTGCENSKTAAVIRNDSDDVRPYNAIAEYKDFHEFLTRLGNPINK